MIVQFLSGSSVCQPHLLRWSQMIWASELDAMISSQKNMEAGSDSASAITRLDSRPTACTGDLCHLLWRPAILYNVWVNEVLLFERTLQQYYSNINTDVKLFSLQSVTDMQDAASFTCMEEESATFPLTWTWMTVNIRKSVC